jgi:hypothetical protein
VGSRPSLHNLTVRTAQTAEAYAVLHWVKGTISNKERVLRRSVGFDPDKIVQKNQAAVMMATAATTGRNRNKKRGNSAEDAASVLDELESEYAFTSFLIYSFIFGFGI